MGDRYVAVDCGKAETKISVRVNSDNSIISSSFATRVVERGRNGNEFDDLGAFVTGNFQVEYDGHHYTVGNFVSEERGFTSTQNSKKDIIHKVATLTAIASVVNTGDNVRVAIGCPIKLYKNQQNRESYLDELLPKGKVEIKINGRDKSFYISQASVYPESTGAPILYSHCFSDKAVGIIDIGGLNINCCVYQDHQLVADTSFTEKLGRRELIEKVRDAIETAEECEFRTYEIEQFIKQGYITNTLDSQKEEESKGFIEEFMKDHLQEIIDSCIQHTWNLAYMDLVFIGGGSACLKKYIEKMFPRAFVPADPQYINSIGFLVDMCKRSGINLSYKIK